MNKRLLFAALMMFCIHAGYADQVNVDFGGQVDTAVYKNDNSVVDTNVFADVISSCTEEAGVRTKEIFSDFDQIQYAENSEYKVNNATNRIWYNNFLNAFNTIWKSKFELQLANNEITLEKYARIAVEVRHYARSFTRNHMKDVSGLDAIKKRDFERYGNFNGATFDWLLNRQLKKQKQLYEKKSCGQIFDIRPIADGGNFDLDKAYKWIINSSTRTNGLVNAFTKCYYYAPESLCDHVGNSFARYMNV